VLSRYYYAAMKFGLDTVIRVTADCPFIDPEVIDSMILKMQGMAGTDYLSNTLKRTFPRGYDAEIVRFGALKKAFDSADKPYQREHVTPYIYQNPDCFRLENFENSRDYSCYRLTLDTADDLKLVKEIYARSYPVNPKFRFKDIIAILEKDSSLALINAHVVQKTL